MYIAKEKTGKNAIFTKNKTEYVVHTRRCASCEHSCQIVGDYELHCHWQLDGYIRGDWAKCVGYESKKNYDSLKYSEVKKLYKS